MTTTKKTRRNFCKPLFELRWSQNGYFRRRYNTIYVLDHNINDKNLKTLVKKTINEYLKQFFYWSVARVELATK